MAKELAELRVEHLAMKYRSGTVALRDLTMTIQRGLTGLLGPNGAGKTTFMRILATIQRPTAGAVHWEGRDAVKAPAPLRHKLGYLPQDFGAPASFTGIQVVQRMGALRGLQGPTLARNVAAALAAVHLSDSAHKPVGTYSGGMLRRLGIAQAIVHHPQVLIVDEPTAGLDPEERVQFRKLLADLAQDRIAILSTHIVSDIEFVAEHVAVITRGQLLYDSSTQRLLQDVRGHTWSLIASAEAHARLQHDPAVRIAAAIRRSDGVELRIVLTEGIPPAGAQPLEPNLEDAYLYLMAQQGMEA